MGCSGQARRTESRLYSADPELVQTIVDGLLSDTRSLAESVDLAMSAGLSVEGWDPEAPEMIVYFVDPTTGEVELTVSHFPKLFVPDNADSNLASFNIAACPHRGTRFMFDKHGRSFALLAKPAGLKLCADARIPNGFNELQRAMTRWNSDLDLPYFGTLGPINDPAGCDVNIQCAREVAVGYDVLGDTEHFAIGDGPFRAARIRLRCDLNDPVQLYATIRHELGHVMGLAHLG
jgi:hypothetical protein